MSSSSSNRVPGRIVQDALLAFPLLCGATWTGWIASGAPGVYTTAVLVAYAALVGLLVLTRPGTLPAPGMGPANRVTLLRATLTLPVAALLVVPLPLEAGALWWGVGMAGVALALDGVDGYVARRTGSATDFGARFDMELDAFLILALSALVWTATPLGAWVLAIGLIRYAFVASAWIWPFMARPLPPSDRRRVICAVQVTGLLVALAPLTPPGLVWHAAFWALVLLVYSFAVDVAWLVRSRAG